MRFFTKISFLLLFLGNTAYSQIFVRAFDYRPTGEFGFGMKPLVSAEIGYKNLFKESRWRSGFSITYLKMTPRLEVFPISGVLMSGGTKVLPGEISYQKYAMVQLFYGVDFAFLQMLNFSAFVGSDIIIGGSDFEYTYRVPSIITQDNASGGLITGVRFRLGTEYEINDQFVIFISANTSMFLVTEPMSLFSANDYGLGILYKF